MVHESSISHVSSHNNPSSPFDEGLLLRKHERARLIKERVCDRGGNVGRNTKDDNACRHDDSHLSSPFDESLLLRKYERARLLKV